MKTKMKNFTSFDQPTRLITCANHHAMMAVMSYVHEIQTVHNVYYVGSVPQMVPLRDKGAHGARCEKVCMLLQLRQTLRSQGSTLQNHMLCITSSTTVASQA